MTLPFDNEIPAILDDLDLAAACAGASAARPLFFKHIIVAMPGLEMDFGVPVNKPVPAKAGIVTGVLPAGRYAEQTYFGPYDNLITVNGALIGWALHAGLEFDSQQRPDGDISCAVWKSTITHRPRNRTRHDGKHQYP